MAAEEMPLSQVPWPSEAGGPAPPCIPYIPGVPDPASTPLPITSSILPFQSPQCFPSWTFQLHSSRNTAFFFSFFFPFFFFFFLISLTVLPRSIGVRKGEKTSYFLVTALRVRLNERLRKLLSHASSIFCLQSLVSFLKSSCLKYLNKLLGYTYLIFYLRYP